MKSIFFYLLVFIGFLFFLGLNTLSASDSQDITFQEHNRTKDPKSQINSQREDGVIQGEGEGEDEQDQNRQKTREKKQEEKAKLAKAEEGSFGMLKDLFQSTFDFFYAPDSTNSSEVLVKTR